MISYPPDILEVEQIETILGLNFCHLEIAESPDDTIENQHAYDEKMIAIYIPYALESGLNFEAALAIAREEDIEAAKNLSDDHAQWLEDLDQELLATGTF